MVQIPAFLLLLVRARSFVDPAMLGAVAEVPVVVAAASGRGAYWQEDHPVLDRL